MAGTDFPSPLRLIPLQILWTPSKCPLRGLWVPLWTRPSPKCGRGVTSSHPILVAALILKVSCSCPKDVTSIMSPRPPPPAECEHYSSNNLSELNPLCSTLQPDTTAAPGITITDPSCLPPSQNPFALTSTNPFDSSSRDSTPDTQKENLMSSPPRKREIRLCTLESNLHRFENKVLRLEAMEPLVTR